MPLQNVRWTFKFPMDISVGPLDLFVQCSVRPMDQWTYIYVQWTFLFGHWTNGHMNVQWTFLFVQWTNGRLFMSNGHVTFTMPRKL